MPNTDQAALQQEWTTLQNNYEQAEKSCLHIKLVALAIFALAYFVEFNFLVLAALILIFWLQEGICKTFQNRLGARILRVEALLQSDAVSGNAFQLHSEWTAKRVRGVASIGEYVGAALRPTVAFPYAGLLLIALVGWIK
jgi:hypothetical protein